jgi:hypothetical protein
VSSKAEDKNIRIAHWRPIKEFIPIGLAHTQIPQNPNVS